MIQIRPEKPEDIEAIETLTIRAFETAEHSDGNEHLILNALRKADQLTLSLTAWDGETLVGHASISPVKISGKFCNWFGLAPVSVCPKYQRQGIGLALVKETLRLLSEQKASGCVVLGEPAFYQKAGFQHEPKLIFPDAPPVYFLAISFEDQTLPKGIVTCHEAFYPPSAASAL